MGIKVSLDGGITYQHAYNGVRIIYDDQIVDDDENQGELHVNATEEGLIFDVWGTSGPVVDTNLGTASRALDILVPNIVKGGNDL